VRGDWRVDFFAKTVVLAGLGLVGITAAIVDSWPSPESHLPRAAALIAPAGAARLAEVIDPVDRPARPAIVRARLRRGVSRSSTARSVVPITNEGRLDAVAADRDMQSLPILADTFIADVPTWRPDAPPPAVEHATFFSPTPSPATISEDSFFTGVVRKTGASVGGSLGKASASVVGAVRVVGDAVRRAF
jgi:hypothetical protein